MGNCTVIVNDFLFPRGREKPPEIEGGVQNYYPDGDKREDAGWIIVFVGNQPSLPWKRGETR